MKKRILIILVFSLALLACSNSKIDGTWVLCYTNSMSTVPDFNEVLTFDNGHFESESYSGPGSYEKSHGLFKLKENQLILNDTIKRSIGLINNDSLILIIDTISYTLKKLNDSFKNTSSESIRLTEKKFEADINGQIFSSIVYHKGKILLGSETFEESQNYYKRINHNGFDIIFQQYAVPKIIKGIKNDTVELVAFHEKTYQIKMWEQ